MANPFLHVQLATTDLDKAKSFYTSLFNWSLNILSLESWSTSAVQYLFDAEARGTMINVGEGTVGMMKHPVPGAPSSWLPYVQVDDITAATAKAKSLGATVMRDVTEVPNAGSFSIIIDPTGAALGLWQQKAR